MLCLLQSIAWARLAVSAQGVIRQPRAGTAQVSALPTGCALADQNITGASHSLGRRRHRRTAALQPEPVARSSLPGTLCPSQRCDRYPGARRWPVSVWPSAWRYWACGHRRWPASWSSRFRAALSTPGPRWRPNAHCTGQRGARQWDTHSFRATGIHTCGVHSLRRRWPAGGAACVWQSHADHGGGISAARAPAAPARARADRQHLHWQQHLRGPHLHLGLLVDQWH